MPVTLSAATSVDTDAPPTQSYSPDAQANPARFFAGAAELSAGLVGQSPAMRQTLDLIRVLAQNQCSSVLILGETGTGKELAARAVHAWQGKPAESFVAINCATMTAGLFESELFGHVKGAFTGADRDKVGLLELAQGGSILLDEISEMSVELQAKLLRVLQEREFRRVGGTKSVRFDATVIASSNRDLETEVAQGRFRRDLYYRLTVLPIQMPPLRHPDRSSDIPLLAEYFLATSPLPKRVGITGLCESAMEKLLDHDWPGNVRELKNVIERAILLESGPEISERSVVLCQCEEISHDLPGKPASEGKREFSLEAAEREFILRALNETGWQRTHAATLLGISRATLHAKLKRYEMASPLSQAQAS